MSQYSGIKCCFVTEKLFLQKFQDQNSKKKLLGEFFPVKHLNRQFQISVEVGPTEAHTVGGDMISAADAEEAALTS